MALAGQVGELVACLQWLTPEQSIHVMEEAEAAAYVESELADFLQYLIRLATVLEVDLDKAVRKKVQLNEARFPQARPDSMRASVDLRVESGQRAGEGSTM